MLVDYPLDCDGVSYLGELARTYNTPAPLDALERIWFGAHQGPLYFTIQWISAELFGFSYATALATQLLFVVGQLFLIWKLLRKAVPGLNPTLLFLTLTLLSCATGIFHSRAALFDFRLDLVGCLWTAIALLAMAAGRWPAALLIALSIYERFHNLPLLLLTMAIVFISQRRSIGTRSLLLPALATILLLGFRARYLVEEFARYFQGHLAGAEPSLRGFKWLSLDGFNFYWTALVDEFFHTTLLLWILALTLLILPQYRKAKKSLLGPLQSLSPLLVGAIVAFALLIINPTRNNTAVIRFALHPVVLLSSCLLAHLLQNSLLRPSLRILPIVLLAVFLEGFVLRDQFKGKSHYFWHGNRYVEQMDRIFTTIYKANSARTDTIYVARNFFSCFELSPLDWEIFLAKNKLSDVSLYSSIKASWSSKFTPIPPWLLAETQYYITGTKHCHGHERTPRAVYGNSIWQSVVEHLEDRCTQTVGRIDASECQIEVSKCRPLHAYEKVRYNL